MRLIVEMLTYQQRTCAKCWKSRNGVLRAGLDARKHFEKEVLLDAFQRSDLVRRYTNAAWVIRAADLNAATPVPDCFLAGDYALAFRARRSD
jgi:hypothetical protein